MEVIDKNEYISKIEVVRILQKANAEGRIKAKDGLSSVLDDIQKADVQPVDEITKIIQARLNGVQEVKIDAMLSGDSTTAYKMVGAETVCISILQDLEALTAKDGDTNG